MALDHGTLTFKNYMLSKLLEFLNIPLSNQVARARNRFILSFNDRVHDIEEKRMALLKEYGELDADGNLQLGTDGHYKMRDKDGFTVKYDELMADDFEIVVGTNLADVQTVYGILQNLPTQLGVSDTKYYDDVMVVFENWEESEKAKV